MKKNIFIFLVAFILVGELLIRFDHVFKILEEKRIVKIKTDIEITPEYKLLQDTSFVFSEDDLKIMVLGDSYIFGGGIEFKDNFSQNLKRLINSEKGNFNNAWVLDVSRPSANNLDHNLTYFQFVKSYKPNVVIIGYNTDDIHGYLSKTKKEITLDDFKNGKMSSRKTKSFIKKVYDIIYMSAFANYILHNLHNELKANGYIMKGSQADLELRSYWQNDENWQKSKILLSEIIEHSEKNDIQLIIYKFQEINLLEYPSLFTKTNIAIKDFFTKRPSVIYLDGSETFRGEKSEKYRLSKYDGHPNEKAHKKMATEVFEVIKNNRRAHNRVDGSISTNRRSAPYIPPYL